MAEFIKNHKKLFIAVWIVMLVISVGLIPLNMIVFPFAEWIAVVFMALSLIAGMGVFLSLSSKIKRTIIAFITLIVMCISFAGSFCNPYWSSELYQLKTGNLDETESFDKILTYEQAEQDLSYMLGRVKKCHPNFKGGVPEEIQSEYDSALESLKDAEEITVNDVKYYAEKILSLQDDGHTSVKGRWNDLRYLSDVPKRSSENFTLSAVNDITIEQLWEENKDMYSYELESWGISLMKSDLSNNAGLDYLGFGIDEITYTWENPEGEKETCTYTADDYIPYEEYEKIYYRYFEEPDSDDFVSYTVDEENSLAVLTLTECNYNDIYKDLLNKMFTEIKDKGIRNVAVDLRGNGGGNSLVADEFIKYLDIDEYKISTFKWRLGIFTVNYDENTEKNSRYDDLTFKGNVYILTDVDSFSSAMMFAQFIKDNGLGTIIGEPPGNNPNGYGDISFFRLPESGLYLSVSTKKFIRASGDESDSLVKPDIECDGDDSYDEMIKIIQEE